MGNLLGKLRRRFGGEEGTSEETAAGESGEARAEESATAEMPRGFDERPARPAADERLEILERLRRRIAAADRKWRGTAAETPRAAKAASGPPERTFHAAAIEALPGRHVQTPLGPVRVIAETVPRAAGHGRFAVGAFAGEPARLGALRLLYRLAEVPDPERLVFLDTETTGLAGGAGTLPFLVGLAWLDGGDVRLEQVFLDHPRDEPAMVAYLRERLARFTQAVTYNGRAFDIPLLQNRFVLNRTPWPSLGTSLDLLAGARRLHRRHLDDRSLTSIERHVLGFHREDDVPGSEIPGIYHRFLLTGAIERLAGVIRHNAWDIVALAALLGLQARLLEIPDAAAAFDPGVDLALGELRYLAGDLAGATLHLGRAAERSVPCPGGRGADDVRTQALLWLARAGRRRGRHDESAACWRRILEHAPGHGAAHLGLAKHHEHRTRDFDAAERHARAAAAAGAEGADEALRRLARVRSKLCGRPSPGEP